MAYNILLIEDPAISEKDSLSTLLTPEQAFRCHRTTWESISPEQMCSSHADLIVAVAAQATPNIVTSLKFLGNCPMTQPLFVVLPQSCEKEFLAIALGTSTDFLFSPVKPEELLQRLHRILPDKEDLDDTRRRLTQEFGLTQIIGNDPEFLRAIERIPRIGSCDAPVLITGETGTGKEVCARAVHLFSCRSKAAFIPVECGAIPENLAESELFGHVRGAFTDAHTDHRGLVALAEGGTLFLDEIDSLSLITQAKLLRFLEEGSYRQVGGERFSQANVRIIAASNRDLEQCTLERTFRRDLFFRLNVLTIYLPALRERCGDIELLARHFVRRLSLSSGKPLKSLSAAAQRKLERHSWLGNVRELYNVVQRAVVFSQGKEIQAGDIDIPCSDDSGEETVDFRAARYATIQMFERRYTQEMMRKHKGNITRAAREAGIDRRSFGRLAKKYALSAKPAGVGDY